MYQGRFGSEAHDRVLAVLQDNAASLLRVARLNSLCDDDAQDAYQRGLEIFLRRLDQVDPATAGQWLRTYSRRDRTPPQLTVSAPATIAASEPFAPEVATADPLSGVAATHLEVSVDGEPWRTVQGPDLYPAGATLRFRAQAVDRAGNVSGFTAAGEVKVVASGALVPTEAPTVAPLPTPPQADSVVPPAAKRSTRLFSLRAIARGRRLTISGRLRPTAVTGRIVLRFDGRRIRTRVRRGGFLARVRVNRVPERIAIRYRGDARHLPAQRKIAVATARRA